MAAPPSVSSLLPDPEPRDFVAAHRGRVGMLAFLSAEAVFFATLVVVYLFYLGQREGQAAGEALRTPWFGTACLLASSATVWAAHRSIRKGAIRSLSIWTTATAVLATVFLAGTALEWSRSIAGGFWIDTNLFGTTYYTLVGFHALHVTIGLVGLVIVAVFAWAERVEVRDAPRVELLSWYWHFVDSVWVVVFGVVYGIGGGA